MARPILEAALDDGVYVIRFPCPGKLKNAIRDVSVESGVSFNGWIAYALYDAIERGVRLPEVNVVPTISDEIRGVALGEEVSGPCGFPMKECEGRNAGRGLPKSDPAFCLKCQLRVR